MDTTGTTVDRDAAARDAAGRMAAAAAAWLDALDPAQRAVAAGVAPSADAESDAERRRWFYTPTDHGGLTLGAQRQAQQRLAFRLVASGLSVAGYNTVATIVGVNRRRTIRTVRPGRRSRAGACRTRRRPPRPGSGCR